VSVVQLSAPTRQRNGRPNVIPSKNRLGRLRRAVRRCFIVSNGGPICISDVLKRAYPRLRTFPCGHRWSVRVALLREAEVIGRMLKGRGRPNLWALGANLGAEYRDER
jgi:hypothetical protein